MERLMDIEQLYRDFNIPHETEGHKHCRPGWVNTICPFCTGNEGLHLGYDTNGNKFVCWRCGGKYAPKVISILANVTYAKAFELLNQYGAVSYKRKEPKKAIRAKIFKLPSNSTKLQLNHRTYLEKRTFDPDKLEKEWGLLGTGPLAKLDKLNYKHRIIIPFYWGSKMVSFDSRDITDKAKNKYMACAEAREHIGHKQILYGLQDKWSGTGICVEGPSDVWRFGNKSFATSGIKYTSKQVRIMANTFKRVAVCYDDDPQAIIQAEKLVSELKFRGVDAFRVAIIGDPGAMSQKEADYLVKQLI